MKPPLNATIMDGKLWLRSQLDEGAHCPLCHQFAKVYKRQIHSTIARAAITVFRVAANDWAHVATVVGPACEFGKLRYWGLAEEQSECRLDGGRSGWWRLTADGVAWVQGLLRVPKYALIYDGQCLGLDRSGGTVSITDALGTRFDYAALMAGM